MKDPERYHCDDCVPRGCSCNINHETGIEDMDPEGRLLPCCEYDYSFDGYDTVLITKYLEKLEEFARWCVENVQQPEVWQRARDALGEDEETF